LTWARCLVRIGRQPSKLDVAGSNPAVPAIPDRSFVYLRIYTNLMPGRCLVIPVIIMVKQRIPEGEEILDDDTMSMEDYSENCLTRESEYRGKVRFMLDEVGIPQGAKVLQIGPGPDWMGIWLAQERPDISIIGLEPSGDMIRVAIVNRDQAGISGEQIRYTLGVVEDLSAFDDSTFDFIFTNDSLHHWVNPVKGFKEINRVLKVTGGLCILDERRDLNIRETLVVEVIGRILARKWLKYWKSSINASYTAGELKEMLETAEISGWRVTSEFLGVRIVRPTLSRSRSIAV
jgi:ubiquinone/menaquinone biosynthesis C-methylase UbiE